MPDNLITTAPSRLDSDRAKAAGAAKRPRGFRFSDDFMKQIKDRREEYLNGRREVIQFEDSTGLGVRVSQSGQISFIVQLKLKDGSRHRETLGAYGKLTIEALARPRRRSPARSRWASICNKSAPRPRRK